MPSPTATDVVDRTVRLLRPDGVAIACAVHAARPAGARRARCTRQAALAASRAGEQPQPLRRVRRNDVAGRAPRTRASRPARPRRVGDTAAHRHGLWCDDLAAILDAEGARDAQAREALRAPDAERAFVQRYSSIRADLRHVPLAVYLQDLVEMFRPAPLPQALGVPTLALLSTAGTFAEPAAMRAALAGPRVTIERVDCHHWPLTERPREVREAIEAWIDQECGCASPPAC